MEDAKMFSRIFWCAILLCGGSCYGEQNLPFKRLMAMDSKQAQMHSQDRLDYKMLSKDYKKKIAFLKKRDLNSIPKKIHFIWLGPKSFPENSVRNVLSWQKLHPNWEIFFWTDSEDRPIPVPGMKKRLVRDFDFGPFTPLIAKSDNWGEKSDLMRIIILLKEGGLYADHDITCIRSWDNFAASYDFVTALQKFRMLAALNTKVTPEISLILSRPNHPILKKMMKKILVNWDSVAKKFAGPKLVWQRVIHHTYMHFASTTKKYHKSSHYRNLILPASYIYLYNVVSQKELRALDKAGYVYALHEGAGEWIRHRK
jgi:mannosyltransferase OCH1-like enzyme